MGKAKSSCIPPTHLRWSALWGVIVPAREGYDGNGRAGYALVANLSPDLVRQGNCRHTSFFGNVEPLGMNTAQAVFIGCAGVTFLSLAADWWENRLASEGLSVSDFDRAGRGAFPSLPGGLFLKIAWPSCDV